MSTRFYKREECRCSNDGMKPEEEKKAGDGFGNDREVLVGGRCDREKQLCILWFKMLSLELRGRARGPVPHACLSVSEHTRNQSAIWYTRQENRDRFCAHREEMDEQGYSRCWIILSLSVIQQGRRQIHLAFIWLSVLRLKRERTRDRKRRERENTDGNEEETSQWWQEREFLSVLVTFDGETQGLWDCRLSLSIPVTFSKERHAKIWWKTGLSGCDTTFDTVNSKPILLSHAHTASWGKLL